MLTLVKQSQCGTPVFIIPDKEGTVKFITEYLRLNHKFVRKTYPLPRIGEIIQKLERFQCMLVLDLNIGYYTIRLSLDSQYMTTIVTEFGKFNYNRLLMGMCHSGDIFQAEVDKLLGDIKDVKTYIDDILVLIKKLFSKNMDQQRIIFSGLCAVG